MNYYFLFPTVILFALTIVNVNCAVARLEVQLGKEARFDFGKDMFFIKRTTPASSDAQYLFASPNQDGSWTTDGTKKIKSSAHLYWNGTIVFKSVTKDDIGSYEMPLEPARMHVAKTMIDMVVKS